MFGVILKENMAATDRQRCWGCVATKVLCLFSDIHDVSQMDHSTLLWINFFYSLLETFCARTNHRITMFMAWRREKRIKNHCPEVGNDHGSARPTSLFEKATMGRINRWGGVCICIYEENSAILRWDWMCYTIFWLTYFKGGLDFTFMSALEYT